MTSTLLNRFQDNAATPGLEVGARIFRGLLIFAVLAHLLTVLVGLFAPGYQYRSLEMWATAFLVYTFIGLALSRQTRWHAILIGGLMLLVLARFGWAWIWGDPV